MPRSSKRSHGVYPTVEALLALPLDVRSAVVRGEDGVERYYHRHVHPDRSLGGWVAGTAHVDPSCRITEHVLIDDQAHVTDGSALVGRVRVGGKSVVKSTVLHGSIDVQDDTVLIARTAGQQSDMPTRPSPEEEAYVRREYPDAPIEDIPPSSPPSGW